MAIRGIERLRAARHALDHAGEPPASRWLHAAASEVWSAMIELSNWPTELRLRAVELQSSLLRYGPISMTLEQMVPPERLKLRWDLLAFIDHAEELHNASIGDAINEPPG